MKPRNKILTGVLAVLAVIAAGVCTSLLRAPKPEKRADETPLPEVQAPELPHYAIVTSQAQTSVAAMRAKDLSERLTQAGVRAVLATLPEGSSAVGKPELAMTENREATLTGEVAVPAHNGTSQRSYAFFIKLNFLPEGDSEPQFPEFWEIAVQ